MSDLISREALVREVMGLSIVSTEVMNYANAVAVAIEDAPSVDAVEVVHGRWITEKCDHVPWRIKNPEKWVIYKCSVCRYSNGRKHSNYCPNCGAKMDGGSNDGTEKD